MSNILIIGGGFGGLVAAERLSSSVGKDHRITLVSPNRKFTFYPGLVQLAFGVVEEDDLTFDLGERLSELNVRYIQGELLRLNASDRKAQITGSDLSGEVAYDHLILALGRRLATERIGGFFENAHHLLGVKAALKFGSALRDLREGTIVVGLCPEALLPVPVCETAFALARRFEDGVRSGKIRIKVLFPGSLKEAFGGAEIHRQLESAFDRNRINVIYNVPVNEITENEVLSADKHRIAYDILMLLPPFRGQAILKDLNALDGSDFLMVDGLMRVHHQTQTYAVGDMVAFSGPKFAHMAIRQANVAADNLIAELSGEAPATEYYHEIAAIIDSGGADSIYLHYGVWDDMLFNLKQGRFWGIAKNVHDAFWQKRHG